MMHVAKLTNLVFTPTLNVVLGGWGILEIDFYLSVKINLTDSPPNTKITFTLDALYKWLFSSWLAGHRRFFTYCTSPIPLLHALSLSRLSEIALIKQACWSVAPWSVLLATEITGLGCRTLTPGSCRCSVAGDGPLSLLPINLLNWPTSSQIYQKPHRHTYLITKGAHTYQVYYTVSECFRGFPHVFY